MKEAFAVAIFPVQAAITIPAGKTIPAMPVTCRLYWDETEKHTWR